MGRSDKKTKRAVEIKGTKNVIPFAKTGSYDGVFPTFVFRKYDTNAPWASSVNGKPIVDDVFNNLRGFEGLTWREIKQASGARSHGTNNHFIEVDKFSKDAKKRIEDLSLNEDTLFSMHIEVDARLWGIIEPTGHFFVIWFDPEHKVYPVGKK